MMLTMRLCSIEFIKIISAGGCSVSTYLRFHSLRANFTHALQVNGYAPEYAKDAASSSHCYWFPVMTWISANDN
jgi:hypothetical protein